VKNTYRVGMVMAATTLAAALLLAQAPGLGQAPAPANADDKAKTLRARRLAQQFETQARVLTVFDRQGKVVTTVGERAIYSNPVFSPDGTRLAVIKNDLESETQDLWVLDIATGNNTRITSNKKRNEERATGVVWSPDGGQLAYVALRGGYEGLYRKASNGQGAEELLFQLPGSMIVLTDWTADGRYLSYYSTDLEGGILWALPLEGERKPVELLRSPFQVLEARISPDHRFVAYRSNETGKNEIFVRAFNPTGAALPAAAAGPRQVSNNEGGLGLNFWRQDGTELYYMGADRGVKAVSVGTVPAIAFGKPRELFKLPDTIPVRGTPGTLGNIARDGQRVAFALPPPPQLQLITVFDRQGKVLSTVGEAGLHYQPRLSPDGTRLAVLRIDRNTGNQDIWTFDVATGKNTAVTNDAWSDNYPIWSPDGSQVLYVSTRGAYAGIYRKAWDGSGSEELLFRYTPGAPIFLNDMTSDGKFLIFHSSGFLLLVPLSGDQTALEREAIEWMREEYGVRWGRFTPDSRFVAYVSDVDIETETFEIHVRPFDASKPEVGAGAAKPVQVSKADRDMVSWRQDGKEMYYLQTDPQTDDALVMAVDVSTTPTFHAGTPQQLFRLQGLLQGGWGHSLWVSRDGRRFVVNVIVPVSAPAR